MARAYGIWVVHLTCEDHVFAAFTVKHEMIDAIPKLIEDNPGGGLIVTRVVDNQPNHEQQHFKIEDFIDEEI